MLAQLLSGKREEWFGGKKLKKVPQEKNPHMRSWCSLEIERHLLWLQDRQEGEGEFGESLLAADGDGPSGLKFGACKGRTFVPPVSGVGEWTPLGLSTPNTQRRVQPSFLPWPAHCSDHFSMRLWIGWALRPEARGEWQARVCNFGEVVNW